MCISSARFSLLINGTSYDHFSTSNGLRQRLPLSPLLFTLVTSVLNMMLALAQTDDLIKGISFSNSSPSVLNIQYVDDTLIFLSPFEEYLCNLKKVLCCFQLVLGLKINFQKSSITSVVLLNTLVERYKNISVVTLPLFPSLRAPPPFQDPLFYLLELDSRQNGKAIGELEG